MNTVIDIIKDNKKLSTEKNFIVNLEKSSDEVESYELEKKNIIKFEVQLPSTVPNKPGEIVSSPDYTVEICLSREARLGLGIELIRSAVKGPDKISVASEEEFYFTEMYPITRGHAGQDYGVFLHPESCKLLLFGDEGNKFDTIEEEIERSES